MFYHLKTILRNLRFNAGYSFINILGLAVGLTTTILILSWVQDELSFDRFHHRSDDIYFLNSELTNGHIWDVTPAPIPQVAQAEIPEIEMFCRTYTYGYISFLRYDEQVTDDIHSVIADSTFFSIFNFKIVKGDPKRLLSDPSSIVISESIAKYLFKDEDPIGKTIRSEHHKHQVSGVMEDMPLNTSVHYDVVIPFTRYELDDPEQSTAWTRANFRTYLLVQHRADIKGIENKLNNIQIRHSDNSSFKYRLQPLPEVNFYNPDGTAKDKTHSCRLFSVAAIIVLIIACINYINLITARASKRNKEIFVRNVLGAKKGNLFFQFLNESVLVYLLALVLATLLIYLVSPAYNHISAKQLEFNLFSIQTLKVYGLCFILIIIFAGIYPALNLSSQRRLRGNYKWNTRSNSILRSILVILQFTATIVLITGSLSINRQLKYIRDKNLGYNQENTIYISMHNIQRDYEVVKSGLLQVSGVTGITATSQLLNGVTSTSNWINPAGERKYFIYLSADKDMIPVMGMKMLAGDCFSEENADGHHFILNETGWRETGFTDPIGQEFQFNRINGTIIGIVEDFHFNDLHMPIRPLVINASDWRYYMYIKTTAHHTTQVINALEEVWKRYNPDYPFTYHFMDDDFEQTYKSDIRTGKIINWFAVVAIFISCLGILGLVAYMAETKTKEIGIRKVLGANTIDIIIRLSREFLLLIGVSIPIALPVAYYWLDSMLQSYAYRLPFNWWIFILSSLSVLTLALLTACIQSYKAASANPVKSIKTE